MRNSVDPVRCQPDDLLRLARLAVEALSIPPTVIRQAQTASDVVVSLGGRTYAFGTGRLSSILAWERLTDALPGLAEMVRLGSMHAAAGAPFPAPWATYATAVTVAWLRRSCGGVGTAAWAEEIALIGHAASVDGTLRLRGRVDPGSSLEATFRRRELTARLRLSSRLSYRSSVRTLITRDVIPHTVADALRSRGRDLADVVDAPWLGGAATVAEVSVFPRRSALRIHEELVPLEPIPGPALAVPGLRGPPHAPWLLAADERDALDVVDALAHRIL